MSNNNDEMTDLLEFHIAVIVEWDGKNPGGTWYDYLHNKMGLYVRGNKDEYESPLARRHALNRERRTGVIFQEGMYLCRNNDVAKQIAHKAMTLGAKNVIRSRMYMDEFTLHEDDVKVLNELQTKQSMRGRKPLDEAGRYTISCLSELTSFEVELTSQPLVCPSCGAMRFYANPGKQKVYAAPSSWDGYDLYEYWTSSRFDDNGKFGIPRLLTKPGKKASEPPVTSYKYPEPKLFLPPDFKANPMLWFKIWDACYALGKYSPDDRRSARRDALGIYMNAGGQKMYMLGLPKGGYDIVDLAILMFEDLQEWI